MGYVFLLRDFIKILKGVINKKMSSSFLIDLQSYGDTEKLLYGGPEAYSYFNREINKCMPFSQRQCELKRHNGTSNFGYTWSVVVDNDLGDYMTNCWLAIQTPEVKVVDTEGASSIRWTENLMHNLIEECTLTFNETVVSKINNFSLDFVSEFNIPDSKYKGYQKFIGNDLTEPQKVLEQTKLFLPLPLFFCKDTGNAVPLTALPHTEIRINFKFRSWENLLILYRDNANTPIVPVVGQDILDVPSIPSTKLFGTFINVSPEERSKIGVKSKLMVIDQIQTSPRQMLTNDSDANIDLLFKHSVKSLFFAARNSTYKNVWSDYTAGGQEIIKSASIKYNDKLRVDDMPSEYFHYINTWYHSKRLPTKPGLYAYHFSLDLESSDPCGGVCLSRIDNPSLSISLDRDVINDKGTFELVVIAVSNNLIKINEGVITFV